MAEVPWAYMRDSLREWKEQFIPSNATLHDQTTVMRRHFADAVGYVEERGGQIRGLTRTARATAVAMLVLGPETGGDPPVEAWTELMQNVSKDPRADAPEWCLDISIAFGCGWHREVKPGRGVWDRVWEMALLAFIGIAEDEIRPAVYWLTDNVPDFPGVSRSEMLSLAVTIGFQVTREKCSCWEEAHKWGGKPVPRERRCQREHRLSQWQPGGPQSLRGFVRQAVRGWATRAMRSSEFDFGTLYPLLREDTGLLVTDVEFKTCHICHETQIREAIQQGKQLRISKVEDPFQGHSCPDPKLRHPADPELTYHLCRGNWFVIPLDRGGAYVPVERWHCKWCGNYYHHRLKRCPLCSYHRKAKSRPANLWIYRPPSVYRNRFERMGN